MFERYTEKTRQVILFARYEAMQCDSQFIAPEHILIGLMRQDVTICSGFSPFGVFLTLEDIRLKVKEKSVLPEPFLPSAEIAFAPETKQVLIFADEESQKMKCRQIDSEHLLLGLVRQENTMAADIFLQFGLSLQNLRPAIARQIGFPNFC